MSRASQYQRFGQPKQAQPGTLAYAMQQTGGDLQKARAEYDAYQAGFSSVADQQANRMMRNQLEMKAQAAGVPLEQAYGMVQGDLTNTAALQEAWNKLPATPVTPPPQDPIVKKEETTDKADEITQQAEDTLSAADQMKILLDDWERRQKAAAEEAERIRIQSQKTFAANMERANMTPNLQIMPATGTPDVAGTQGFKSRRRQAGPGIVGSILAGLNLGQSTAMNV